MRDFEKAAQIFESSFLADEYFDSMSCEFAKNTLINIIKNTETPLAFLLGDPGVGKTYMLHLIKKSFSDTHKILFASDPFTSAESFLQFLLGERYDANLSILDLKESAIAMYRDLDHIIMIDEAQLLDESILEYIRILSDTKVFNFILSMHKDDGMAIVKKPHFASRDHRVVTIGLLEKKEFKHYLESRLLQNGLGSLAESFKDRELSLISRYANGNFRMSKQMLKHLFLIMDHAKINGLEKYVNPNRCVITMAAIDLGFLDE
jgi:predicted AAA+ superfamily ATPase